VKEVIKMNVNAFYPKQSALSRNNREGHASHAALRSNNATLARGIIVGSFGGLMGTIIMDLFEAVMFLTMGEPAGLSFSIIGDAAAAFFSMFGIVLSGGIPLGASLHYLIGLALGGILGVAVLRIDGLRVDSAKKSITLGILFVEVMSEPLLITTAIVLNLTTSQTVQLFGVSFVMRLVYGGVLGAIISRLKYQR
jgi:hypothetical protein